MRKRRTNLVLGAFLLGWTAIACSAGIGPPAALDDPYDRPPDSRDKPGDSRDKPTDTFQAPPHADENPGSQGGGPAAGGGSNCAPCDGTFKCTQVSNGKTKTDTIILQSASGGCAIVDSKGKPEGFLACGGGVVSDDGQVAATWQRTGPDSFSATASATVNGQTVTATTNCVRDSGGTTTQPTGTVTATPAPTPTPTATGTAKPPPTVVDAGTKG